jgi:hypothetical protein
MKPLSEWTRKEFEQLPMRENWSGEIRCRAIVLIPSRLCPVWFERLCALWSRIRGESYYYAKGMHDSGYRCMDFVAVNKDNEPFCRLSGCSDVVHIDGIGGMGYKWLEQYGRCPKMVPPTGWSIDCLPKSGLFRMFARGDVIATDALSSFEIYAVDSEPVAAETKQ